MSPSLAARTMRRMLLLYCAALGAISVAAELQEPQPIGKAATKAYRQILPDGRIVYSDKMEKGARVDETIEVAPPIKGNPWSTEPGTPPRIPPQTTPTPVNRVVAIPQPGKTKTADEAEAEVARAEMLLEDARKRQEHGVEPLPGERTGNANGTSRLNEAYKARQRSLAEAVDDARAMLKKSIEERDALKHSR